MPLPSPSTLAAGSVLHRIDRSATHGRLLRNHYGIDPKTGAAIKPTRSTKETNKQEACRSIHEASSRINDCSTLLSQALNVITDKGAKAGDKRKATKAVTELILPALDVAAEKIRDGSVKVSPLASGGYANKRDESKRKRDAENSARERNAQRQRKITHGSPTEAVLNQYVDANTARAPLRCLSSRNRKAKLTDEEMPEPPLPRNGMTYGVGEFIQIVETRYAGKGKHGPNGRRAFFDLVCNAFGDSQYHYVPNTVNSVYRVLKRHEQGKRTYRFDEEWDKRGRSPLVKDNVLLERAHELTRLAGQKVMEDKVQNILREEVARSGKVVPKSHQFSSTTVNNYLALLSNRGHLSITANSIAKTNARYTAENSLIGAFCHVIVVAMTQFYVVEEEDVDFLAKISKLDPDDRLLYDLVREFHGNVPIKARHPALVFTEDDTTFVITEGIQETKSKKKGLVSTASLQDSGNHSTYHQDDSGKMLPTRVKLHHISNGTGDVAPVCMTYAGLAEDEMPDPDLDFLVVEVEGLGIGGYGVGDSNVLGYALFMRGTRGAEKKRFEWMRKNLLFPFIDNIRMKYFRFDSSQGVVIPDDLVAVCCADGDNSQLATIVNEESVDEYDSKGVKCVKHNASRTGVEQAADNSKVFPSSKSSNKKITVKEIPSDQHLLKGSLEETFNNLRAKGVLRLKKQGAVVDFMAKFPVLYTRACVRENVIHGFVKTGQLDGKFGIVPVWHQLIATRRTIPTVDEYNTLLNAFFPTMAYSFNNGMQYVSDEYLINEHGFPADIDINGATAIRDAGISQENRQRAKVLNGSGEKKKRADLAASVARKAERKEAEKKFKLDLTFRSEEKIVEQLCKLAGVEVSEKNLRFAKMEHFNRLKAPELKQFIKSRSATMTTAKSMSHLKKPHSALADAQRGVENCVSAAFNVRTLPSRVLAKKDEMEVVSQSEDNMQSTVNEFASSPTVYRVSWDRSVIMKASALLSDAEWMGRFLGLVGLAGQQQKPIDDELKARADQLQTSLDLRFTNHVKTKVPLNQHHYFILNWLRKNLVIDAVHMVLCDHVKRKLDRVMPHQCLLRPACNAFLMCTNAEANLHGAYLHYDDNLCEWIRSGSADGEKGMGGRNDTHRKRAENDTNHDNSRFYNLWPSTKSSRAINNPVRMGHWEDLTQYVAVGFTPSEQVLEVCSKDLSEGGIFFYSEEEKAKIRGTNINGCKDGQKFTRAIAYLFEIGYDIALSSEFNVSESPGAEAFGLRKREDLED